jgi:hypothetical protein
MGAGTRNPIKVLMWCEFVHRLIDIGSEFYSKDDYMSMRTMTAQQQFALFKEWAAKYDTIHERPAEYLKDLCAWLEDRLNKFGTKVDAITLPKLDTSSKAIKFGGAKKPVIENVEEKYEDKYKTVDTLRNSYDH